MKTKYLLLLLLVLELTSCIKIKPIEFKPKEEDLTPPTSVNNLYFYVVKNGEEKICIAKEYNNLYQHRPKLEYNNQAGANNQGSMLAAYRHDNPFFDLSLFFNEGITHIGTYTLMHSDEADPSARGGYTYLYQNQAFVYGLDGFYISEDNCGSIEITYLSPDKREFKGTFNMTLYNPFVINDSIVIKNGFFWVNLDTYNN